MDFSESKIKKIIVHEVGNKEREEGVKLSSSIQRTNDEFDEKILSSFLKSFKTKKELFYFRAGSAELANNMNAYSTNIFHAIDDEQFILASKNIAEELYEHSKHPKTKQGELVIMEISNIKYNEENINAIGIFKSEKKIDYLKILKDDDKISIADEEGISLAKFEKACLILNINEDTGYSILKYDNSSKVSDYWTKNFLKLKQVNDDIQKTKKVVEICRDFSDEVLSKKENPEEKFDFNNDFINYFEENNVYDKESFTETILKDDKLKEDFFKYQESNKNIGEFDIEDSFELSQPDVKKEKRKIKNVIKLDSKLELKVLLDKNNSSKNIEKGFDDDKGMHFYKVFFNEESH